MKAQKQISPSKRHRYYRWAIVIACLAGGYILIPDLKVFVRSARLLHHLNPIAVCFALLAMLATYAAAAATYYVLLFPRLRFTPTIIVEAASVVYNRLVPGGLGGIGANYQYLRRKKIPQNRAAAAVAVNNALGLIGNALIIVLLIIYKPSEIQSFRQVRIHTIDYLIAAGLMVTIAFVIGVSGRLRKRLLETLLSFWRQLGRFEKQPARLGLGLLSSTLLTVGNITCLWLSILAVHGSIGFITAAIALSFAVAAGTLTPTPGGVGGVEAGLIAALLASGQTAVIALAATLVFRLISYWLPFGIGAIALVYAKRQNYL